MVIQWNYFDEAVRTRRISFGKSILKYGDLHYIGGGVQLALLLEFINYSPLNTQRINEGLPICHYFLPGDQYYDTLLMMLTIFFIFTNITLCYYGTRVKENHKLYEESQRILRAGITHTVLLVFTYLNILFEGYGKSCIFKEDNGRNIFIILYSLLTCIDVFGLLYCWFIFRIQNKYTPEMEINLKYVNGLSINLTTWDSEIIPESERVCQITRLPFQNGDNITKLECGHYFKYVESFEWFDKNRECPSCSLIGDVPDMTNITP